MKYSLFITIIIFSLNLKAQSFYSVLENYTPPEGWEVSFTYDGEKKSGDGTENEKTVYSGTLTFKNSNTEVIKVKYKVYRVIYTNPNIQLEYNRHQYDLMEYLGGNSRGIKFEKDYIINCLPFNIEDSTNTDLKMANYICHFTKYDFVFNAVKDEFYIRRDDPYMQEYLNLGNSLRKWLFVK